MSKFIRVDDRISAKLDTLEKKIQKYTQSVTIVGSLTSASAFYLANRLRVAVREALHDMISNRNSQ